MDKGKKSKFLFIKNPSFKSEKCHFDAVLPKNRHNFTLLTFTAFVYLPAVAKL